MKTNLALHEAVEAGDAARAKALLTEDAYQTKAKDVFGETALHLAAKAGRADLTRLMLDHVAAVDPASHARRTPLHLAAERGHVEVAEALLAHRAKPNAFTEAGETPLHLAARGGHLDMVRLLLAKGADPNLMGDYGGSALHEAAASGHLPVAEALLAAGAMANAQSKGAASVWTPWNEARKAGHGVIADLLRSHGGEDRARGPLDMHRAAERGYIGRVRTLLDLDPGVLDSRDFLNRRTALHWAAEKGDLAIADLLLGRGAARALTDKQGRTPLDLAMANGHAELAGRLRA